MKNRKSKKLEPTKIGKLAITKIDAAVRQLETAVRLWFYDADPVSIATLTHAGYQIISDLNKRKGGKSMMMMEGGGMIKEEFLSDYIRVLRATPNFFKHADEDPDETHYFAPQVNELLLLDAIDVYGSWELEKRPIFTSFSAWMSLSNPRIIKKEFLERMEREVGSFESITEMGKKKFFEISLAQTLRI